VRKPNVIVLLLDCVRADHCSVCGYERPTTPGLERLAERAVVYEQAISPAIWTMASLASLFTGTYPSTHRFVRLGQPFPSEFRMLAEALRDAGYYTFGLGTWIPFFGFGGLDRGFEQFEPRLRPTGIRRLCRWLLSLRRRGGGGAADGGGADQAGAEALPAAPADSPLMRWLKWQVSKFVDKGAKRVLRVTAEMIRRRDPDRPFFAYVHIGEAHGPYRPPWPYRNKYRPRDVREVRDWRINQDPMPYYLGEKPISPDEFRVLAALYDGAIEYQDKVVYGFYRELERMGLAENTVFAVLADHGECIGEKGLFRHSFCVYEPLVHVLLTVVYPDVPGRRESRVVQTLDLPRTIAELAGADGGFLEQQQGNSLLEPGTGARPPDFAVSELVKPLSRQRLEAGDELARYNHGIIGFRSADYKYIWRTTGEEEFYCLRDDPREGNNRIGDPALAEAVNRFRTEGSPWITRFTEAYTEVQALLTSGEAPDLSPEVEARLRDLGYVE